MGVNEVHIYHVYHKSVVVAIASCIHTLHFYPVHASRTKGSVWHLKKTLQYCTPQQATYVPIKLFIHNMATCIPEC